MKRGVILILLLSALQLTARSQRYFVCSLENLSASETFIVKASDPSLLEIVDLQLSLPINQRNKFIRGTVDSTDGGFNAPWSWHIPENEWELVNNSSEQCDGKPSDIENNLTYWLDTVKTFCPWGSYIEREIYLAGDVMQVSAASMLLYNGNGSFTLDILSAVASAELSIYTVSGQRIVHVPYASDGMQVSVPGIISGVYFAVIREQQSLYHQKLLLLQ